MSLSQNISDRKRPRYSYSRRLPMRCFAGDPDCCDRRARFFAERLTALQFASFLTRCALAKADDAEARALLGLRLDIVDARSADFFAMLRSIEAAA